MKYSYKCLSCNKKFEIEATFSTKETIEPKCPFCKETNAIRDYSTMNFILSGNGFYKTDNRKEEKE